ncbi:ABC-type branched-subunit amino acid transport system ATPase component OS=Castellaniella defragrans OX=75697 GN=HNR28_001739 PE=3 SV=1 [Castellaniella defragrans]
MRENLLVVMPRAWNARTRGAAGDRVYAAIEGWSDISGTMASSLSGGQRQSRAAGMALVREPKLMVLDDRTAALSPLAAQSVFQRIVHVRESGIPILLAEQNVKPAMAISDRAYFLENGRNFMDGPVAEMADDPRIRTIYLGG